MRAFSVKARILFASLSAVFILGISISLFGSAVIKKYIFEKAQEQVKDDLKTVRAVYDKELHALRTAFDVIDDVSDLDILKKKMGLDYIAVLEKGALRDSRSTIVKEAFRSKQLAVNTRIIEPRELEILKQDYLQESSIPIKPTPKARPTDKKTLESVMSIECARPFFDIEGNVSLVLYGGKIINKNFDFIHSISEAVFENRLYDAKPVGTVTIFQDDVRVVTTVLDRQGAPAIGTRVSDVVYRNVVESGRTWIDRAFVVTDWYLTAYEPIRNIEGKIIGILYVGILEKPFIAVRNRILAVFWVIIGLACVVATLLSYMTAYLLSKSFKEVVRATREISGGQLNNRVTTEVPVKELKELAEGFNAMAAQLAERECNLEVSNRRLSALNESYLDLISFVTHELKGILSSAILNAHSVRDGYLGLVNFKQRKALDSVTKTLDHLAMTVQHFLNLSRIEKGELTINKAPVLFKEEVADEAVETFSRQAMEKALVINNKVEKGLRVSADPELLKVVMNNLLSNAVKYSAAGGSIAVTSSVANGNLRVEVYNDAAPFSREDKDKIFKKFFRLANESTRREKGTGLGLFITREIIERHNGRIWIEAKERGNSFIFEIERQAH